MASLWMDQHAYILTGQNASGINQIDQELSEILLKWGFDKVQSYQNSLLLIPQSILNKFI